MSYEITLRLPSATQYAFADIKVIGESVEEIEYRLTNEIAKLANIVGTAEATANAVFTLAENGLEANQVQTTPPPATAPAGPTPPWKQAQTASTSADPAKPWLKAQAGAPMQAGNTPPADENTFRVSFGYMEGPKFEEFKKFTGSFYTDHKNSFSKPKGEDLYRFYRKPSAEQIEAVKAGLDYFGGTIVSM